MSARWPLGSWRAVALPTQRVGPLVPRRPARLKELRTDEGSVVERENEAEVLAQIRGLRDRVRHVAGSLVASVDGRLVAHDTHGIEPDGMAAMSAAVLGLSQRVIESVGPGQFAETVTRGTRGYVATYAAGPRAVLTVLTGEETNIGRLHLEARQVANRLAALLEEATSNR
ncbi:roadblock/LC7 domain-containing protein [Cryptosporangium phraense]|uniref:Diacylglyceryl transferase n=1 Tax=Cryptosporangium phraense TaxID=2593070 RepID=A0A545AYD0_9ACTN|nr:roadblock/LC7 domain-containing protein [Cryptosporangium phraense]TQS46313.1 diacylglyceryl transferase [Cryptosporangium phraense]